MYEMSAVYKNQLKLLELPQTMQYDICLMPGTVNIIYLFYPIQGLAQQQL